MQNEKPLIERSYHIPLAMFDDAFRCFQKKYVFPQNIVFSLILAVIAGVYVQAVIKDNTQTMGYLLIVVCVALILSRWYKTFKLRRSVHDALKDLEQDEYQLRIFSSGLEIRTVDMPVEIPVTAADEQPEAYADTKDSGGFQQLFPEKSAEQEEIPATIIDFGNGVKISEFADFFMVYLVRQNFYVIPKKDFSADEIEQMKKLFAAEK